MKTQLTQVSMTGTTKTPLFGRVGFDDGLFGTLETMEKLTLLEEQNKRLIADYDYLMAKLNKIV